MFWNYTALRNSAGYLVGESLSLGFWQSLEGLPVGVQTQAATDILESI